MSANKAVAYKAPGIVEIIDTPYPTFELKAGPGVNPVNVGRKVPHGVILRTVSTNICGSDQHMVRGRTTAQAGLVLGHEITGEVEMNHQGGIRAREITAGKFLPCCSTALTDMVIDA